MKIILFSIFILIFSISAQAEEKKNNVTSYSAATIQQLKIDSVRSLLEHHYTSNGLKIPADERILYLVNGNRDGSSAEEKDNKISAATSIELLEGDEVAVINVKLFRAEPELH